MNFSDCLSHGEHVIAQRSGSDLVLFHMESGNYYSLNELGATIWDLIDGRRPIVEVSRLVETEYDAPAELILADCRELIASLLENDLLTTRSREDEPPG
jgi:Coenzyme PQQ synthesis protein D (PqqD)